MFRSFGATDLILVASDAVRPDVEPSTKQGVALIREEVVAGESVFFHSNAE